MIPYAEVTRLRRFARRHLLGRLVELAGRRADWKALERYSSTLTREGSPDPLVGWATVIGLFNQVRLREAWDALSASGDLVPGDEYQAAVMVTLLRDFAATAASVERVLNLHDRFSHSEQFRAHCLLALYTMRPHSRPLSSPACTKRPINMSRPSPTAGIYSESPSPTPGPSSGRWASASERDMTSDARSPSVFITVGCRMGCSP